MRSPSTSTEPQTSPPRKMEKSHQVDKISNVVFVPPQPSQGGDQCHHRPPTKKKKNVGRGKKARNLDGPGPEARGREGAGSRAKRFVARTQRIGPKSAKYGQNWASTPESGQCLFPAWTMRTSQLDNIQRMAATAQHFLHGRNGHTHSRRSLCPKGIQQNSGLLCAPTNFSIGGAKQQARSVGAALEQTLPWRWQGRPETCELLGPPFSHLSSEDHKAGSTVFSRELRVSSCLAQSAKKSKIKSG